jgi:hypothetical protein
MSEYPHVEKPFLDQLATLEWRVIDQEQGGCEGGAYQFTR